MEKKWIHSRKIQVKVINAKYIFNTMNVIGTVLEPAFISWGMAIPLDVLGWCSFLLQHLGR